MNLDSVLFGFVFLLVLGTLGNFVPSNGPLPKFDALPIEGIVYLILYPGVVWLRVLRPIAGLSVSVAAMPTAVFS